MTRIVDTDNIVLWEQQWSERFETLVYYSKEGASFVFFI